MKIKNTLAVKAAVAVTLSFVCALGGALQAGQPNNPNALPQTRAIFKYLEKLRNQEKTISGQLELTVQGGASLSSSSNHVTLTQIRSGEWPGIIGAQWDPFVGVGPGSMIEQFEEYWNAGGIPHLTSMPRNPRKLSYGRMWHASDVDGGGDGNDYYVNMGNLLSSGPKGSEYNNYYSDLDAIAAELEKLQNKGIPLFFRPLAECNGPWFWWGNSVPLLDNDPNRYEEYMQLWRETYDYLTYTKGLNNLLWVYEVANPPADKRDTVRPHPSLLYPGDGYVDVVAMNSTVDWDEPMDRTVIWPEAYDWMVGRSKPIAFSQCGVRKNGGDPKGNNMKVINGIEADFPEVTWWMAWRDHFSIARNDNYTPMLSHGRVVNRDDLPDFRRFELENVSNSAFLAVPAYGGDGVLGANDECIVQPDSNWVRQRWILNSTGDGYYELKNAENVNLVLTVVDTNGGGIGDADRIRVDSDFNGDRQRWKLRAVGNRRYEIISKKNESVIVGLNLGNNGIVSSGDILRTEIDKNKSDQRWYFTMPEVE